MELPVQPIYTLSTQVKHSKGLATLTSRVDTTDLLIMEQDLPQGCPAFIDTNDTGVT